METNERIPIRNIYYMLSYAYQTLSFPEYANLGSEEFHNVADLYAEILMIGIPVLIRGGLSKDYIRLDEKTTVIRGKIDINASIKQNALVEKKLVVLHDEFSEDILLNQLIKGTLLYLSRSSQLSKVKRRKFYSFLPYFSNVSDIELNLRTWRSVRYNRQNIRYQFIVDICRFLYEDLLLSQNGDISRRELNDEQKLSSLFEKFAYAFYKRESSYRVIHPQISWNVDDGFFEALPVMQTDIVLKKGDKTLIIDTKFYSDNMAVKFAGGTAKQKSGNLYQIFTYVNNWKLAESEKVAGMLMYARTVSESQPEHHYEIGGKRISVVNLDLNQDFEGIKRDLLLVAGEWFGEE